MHLKKYCSLVLIAACLSLGFTQSFWKPDFTDLPKHPKIHYGTLDNGMHYILMPNQEPPELVSMRLYVNAGSLMEEDDQQGLAHFVEHMQFQGSRYFPQGMVDYLQRIGMSFGADTNASTHFDVTTYQLDIPKNTEDYIQTGLQAMRDYVDGAYFYEDKLEIERDVVLREKMDRDTIDYRINKEYWSFVLQDTLIAKRFPIGETFVIKNAPKKRLVDFYKKWYQPNRITLVVVGDIDTQQLVSKIKEVFNDAQNTHAPTEPDLGQLKHKGTLVKFHHESESPNTSITIQTIKPYQRTQYTTEDYTHDLLQMITNYILSHRLSIVQKDINNPFINSQSSNFDYLNFFSIAFVTAECDPNHWATTLSTLEKELRKALTFGFTLSEINLAKASLLKQFQQALEQESTLKSNHIANDIVNHLSNNLPYLSAQDALNLAEKALENLTPDLLKKTLQDTWSGDSYLIYISGNASIPDPQNTILKVYQQSTQYPVEPPTEKPIETFAYNQFGAPGIIEKQEIIEALDIHKILFKNNVLLNCKQTPFHANTVHIAIRFGNGLLDVSPSNPGLHILADLCFLEGGLEKYTIDHIREILAAKNIDIGFSVDSDSFLLQASCSQSDLRDTLNVLTAYLLYPGFRQESLIQAHQSIESLYNNLKQTPEGILTDQGMRFLASGDNRFGYPDKDYLLRFSIEDLKTWMEHALTKSTIEISIVGDCSINNMIEHTQLTLGSIPQREQSRPLLLTERTVHFPKTTKRVEFPFSSKISKTWVGVAWPTKDKTDIDTYRKLSVLSAVFTNHMRIDLRDTKGQSYSPSATNYALCTFPKYGYFLAHTTVSPTDSDTVATNIINISQNIIEQGISKDQFEPAIQPLIQSIKKAIRTNSYWLQVLSGSHDYPEQFEWAKTILQDYESLTPEDIYTTAQKYLNPKKSVRIIITPQNP